MCMMSEGQMSTHCMHPLHFSGSTYVGIFPARTPNFRSADSAPQQKDCPGGATRLSRRSEGPPSHWVSRRPDAADEVGGELPQLVGASGVVPKPALYLVD